ncbi:MAG: hypothetical protein JXK16_12275 [Thiotrichales bacterium]|nr:hypothetical protein [Thiotrichales bacterium]
MSQINSLQLKFDAVSVMKDAVAREVRRKKALGQYVIVADKGKVRKIDFSVLKK